VHLVHLCTSCTLFPAKIDPVPGATSREDLLSDSRIDERVDTPRLWRVLLHNDDFTTQEFVVFVLETVFQKDPAEARAIMLNVHHSGIGLAGLYTRDVAETKQRAAQRLAEQQEFPLLVTVEPEPEGAKL
jgi:ATP-dependent Clp protease adaptor protein ClpS